MVMTRDAFRLGSSLSLAVILAGSLLLAPAALAESPTQADAPAKQKQAQDKAGKAARTSAKDADKKARSAADKADKAGKASKTDKTDKVDKANKAAKDKPLLGGPETENNKDNQQRQLNGRQRRASTAVEQALDNIGLSDQQKQQVQDIFIDGRAQRITWQKKTSQEMSELRQQLKDAREKEDAAQVKEVQGKIRALNATAPKASDSEKKIRELLTDEQLVAYEKELKEVRNRRRAAATNKAKATPPKNVKQDGDKADKADKAKNPAKKPAGSDKDAKDAAGKKSTPKAAADPNAKQLDL